MGRKSAYPFYVLCTLSIIQKRKRVLSMKLILDPEVKDFLKKNKLITKQDLINKMYELFSEYPETYTFISAEIVKNNKTFFVDYGTSINHKDIDCVYIREKIDDNRTIKEICLEKAKKQNKQPV
ncbi:hypothetical protein SAMN05660242_1836 [Thermoanaerobacterium sp. RBIITD]|nr:hypothetical protein SAMN05660242_1836 [Thermoanaerobacterium sp. RBIITD]